MKGRTPQHVDPQPDGYDSLSGSSDVHNGLQKLLPAPLLGLCIPWLPQQRGQLLPGCIIQWRLQVKEQKGCNGKLQVCHHWGEARVRGSQLLLCALSQKQHHTMEELEVGVKTGPVDQKWYQIFCKYQPFMTSLQIQILQKLSITQHIEYVFVHSSKTAVQSRV